MKTSGKIKGGYQKKKESGLGEKKWREDRIWGQNLARGGKFWMDEEDIKAGLTMWEAVCKPVLTYGAEVWACSSKADMNRDWNEFKIEQGDKFWACLGAFME